MRTPKNWRKNKKARAQIEHAKRRFAERHRLIVNDHMLMEFVSQIQKGKAIFIKKQSTRIRLFKIKHEEEWYPVVYDKQRKAIVTTLTNEMIDKGDVYE